MGYSLLAFTLVIATGIVALRAAQASRLRRLSLHRAGLEIEEYEAIATPVFSFRGGRAFPPRYRYLPPLAGLAAAALFFLGTSLPGQYAVGAAVLIGTIAHLGEVYWANSRVQLMESQLGDAIDLLVATLRAGS